MDRLVWLFLCGSLISLSYPSRVAAAPATAPAIAPEENLHLGLEQLSAGQNKEAAAFFDRALAGAASQHGKLDDDVTIRLYEADALAYFRNAAPGKARQLMDRARNANKISRSIIINAAIICMADKESLGRALDSMNKFCAANPTDELALNIFGAAIDKATGKFSDGRLAPHRDVYNRINAQLEAAKQGQRRWGNKWISSAEFDQKKSDRDEKFKAQVRAQHRLEEAQLALSNAQDQYARKAQENTRRPLNRRMSLDFEQHRVDNCTQTVKERQDDLNVAVAAIPVISWDYPSNGIDPDPILAMK